VLVVAMDCSVDRSGLGGAGGTSMVAGSGGSSPSMGGRGGGAAPGDSAGSGGAAAPGGAIGSGAAGAGGNAGSSAAAGNAGSSAGNAGSSGAPAGGDGGGGMGGMGGQSGADDAAAGRGGDGGTGEPGDGGDASDVPPPAIGCADGTREAFTDPARFPAIAGCAGGWSVPGLVTELSLAPGCARAAGNDGSNATGLDCTVEDLCADGWHVCRGASELTQLGVTCQDSGIAPATAGSGAMFFATRQRGTAPTGCSPETTTGSNNLHGCGNFGRVEDPGCAPPLDRQLENTVCTANPPWSCNDPTSIMTEAMVATKAGSARGGVLCCR
jgi:hypothetical protein